MSDICPICDGEGVRCFLSGARCLHCGGSGWIEDYDDEPFDWYELDGSEDAEAAI